MRKPNIVLLFADQHNARVLGCAGHVQIHTPNLDRLAGEGVRFSHAHTQNTICTPSRMCYFTGLYPHNHGYYGLGGPVPERLPSMLTHLKNNGYITG